MKKTVIIAAVLLCLMVLVVVCVQQVKAQYQGSVIINSDGSVTPASAPIVQSGNTYSLTGEVDGSIAVNESNIVLNGKGFSLSGGLLIQGVSNVSVENFVVTDGAELDGGGIDGILLNWASHVTVTNNTISGIWSIQEMNAVAFYGVLVWGGGSNVFTGNSLLNNAYGLYLSETQKNLIVDNTFVNNNTGWVNSLITFWDSSNNTIYHNNFIAKYGSLAENPGDSINIWDDGFPAGGNYWGQQTGKEIDNTGISDTPYVIDSRNKDLYPLIQPFNSSFLANYEREIIPPKILVQSPLSETYSNTNISLVFSIDKPFNWIGYSLDRHQNVSVTGNTTLTGLSSSLHSITVYANGTFGNMGASETISFTIAKPFPTVTVAAVSGAVVAALVAAGLLVYFKKRKGERKP